jgi:hypothetical protein
VTDRQINGVAAKKWAIVRYVLGFALVERQSKRMFVIESDKFLPVLE